jgi:hypothetical protein
MGVPSVVSVEKSWSRVPFFRRLTVTHTRGATAKSISAIPEGTPGWAKSASSSFRLSLVSSSQIDSR